MPTSNGPLRYALRIAIVSNSLARPALHLKFLATGPRYGVIFSNATPPLVMRYVASIQKATVLGLVSSVCRSARIDLMISQRPSFC